MKRYISFHKKTAIIAALIFLSLAGTALLADAAITWNGGGTDNLASNPYNWTGSVVPQDADDVIFDGTSTKDCTWDINAALGSLSLNSGYTGTVTLISPLKVIRNVVISDGTFIQNNNDFIIGFNPPVAITDSASSTNGDSAALYATVNPNGLDTTVYFECRTGASYDIGTTPQSIGSGTVSVPVSGTITGLSPDTTYYCRVVVTSAAGTSYGDDVSFMTPPIVLTITSPLNNDTINRPDVMVRGTVTNSRGSETGVTVNGIVAVIYNGQFFVNHVPLDEGQNTITVDAIDTQGNTATTSISVNADAATPHVTLTANIESGIAPLTTYFSVSTTIPNTVSIYEIDFDGDSVIDYSGTTFNNISFTYATEGIYYPTVTVTDDQSNTYSDAIAIVVLSSAELDTLLKTKWAAMKTSLANQNIAGALNYYTGGSQGIYGEMFTVLYDQLPQIVQDMQDIQLIYSKGKMAKYRIRKNELYGGQPLEITYYIYFVVDTDGLWKIEIF